MIIDKNALGYLSLFFAMLSGVPYIFSMMSGKIKPHLFSRIIWTMTAAIAAAGQYASNAGPGAWAPAFSAVFCVVLTILSLKYGESTITRGDWIAFAVGLSAIPLWYFTSDPLPAVVLVTLIDASAYYPTFRKSHIKPKEELAFSYIVSNLKHTTSILAMKQYSATTLFYPVVMFIMNGSLVIMLIWRREVHKRSHAH